MATSQQLNITLPAEMVEAVKAKVASGEYATASEVINDGVRILMARDSAMEDWLVEQVVPAYDALRADPDLAVGIKEVRARLAAEYAALTARNSVA